MAMNTNDDETPSILDRRIAHANKVVTLHNGFETPTTMIFLGQKGETNMKISQKHQAFLEKLLTIDSHAKIKDNNGIEYTTPEDFPNGAKYADSFTIDDSEKKYGNIYVKCEVISKYSLNDIKHGPMNIMDYLKENKIFLKFRKFKTTKEATIGFLHSIHPSATLRSEIREEIDRLMKSVELKKDEYEAFLTNRNDKEIEEGMCEEQEIVFPTYDIVTNTFGFGNGDERIHTTALEMRCAPDDAIHLKKIMTRISIRSTNKIQFMPTGMLQLTGQKTYQNALRSQNEYLQNIATFPLYNTTEEQMEKLKPDILKDNSIKRILKTNNTEGSGRWLI